ncbi:MAG: SRPBCC family protein [Desulfohalobiaceae bacterium]
MKFWTCRAGCDVDASAKVVWTMLTDTRMWPGWGPSITDVDCPTRFIHSGSRGRVRTLMGAWLPFEITTVHEGRFWSWKVAGVPATGHRVTPSRESNGCRVEFEIPVWAFPYVLVCKVAALRIKRLAEEGQG